MLTQSEGTRLYYDYQYRYNEFHMPGRRSGLPRFLIDYLGTDFFHCVASIWVENRELVAELSKLHGVQDIEVNDPSLSDSDLVPITRMRGLKILTVNWPWHPQWPTSYSRITDESLTRISRMQDIEDVYIGSYCFSRRGIDALAKAPALENAHLWGCDLADEKMPYEISRGSDVLVVENNVGQLGRVLGTKIHVK